MATVQTNDIRVQNARNLKEAVTTQPTYTFIGKATPWPNEALPPTPDNSIQEYYQVLDDLLTLKKVGLGYIKIGQQATTLSGGEAQRIKLAKELSKRSTGRTIYILDEPTTGLHQHDIKKLLEILHTFVATGNTVVVIEHNLDVIKTADHVVDMGPDGGIKGGQVIAEGKPEDICNTEKSYTGKFLKPLLNSKFKKIA